MEQTRSLKTLILGLGNPLIGDDGFGAQVLEFLHRNGTGSISGVSLVDAHTDLLNYMEDLALYDRVVLMDAILDPETRLGPPGQIAVFSEEQFLSWPDTSASAHQMSPLMTVKLFRQLHAAAKTQIVFLGLLVDAIKHEPHYATPDRVQLAAAQIASILAG